MKVILVRVEPLESDCWIAHVLLDGEPAELHLEFSEGSVGLDVRIAAQHRLLYARFEGTREQKEVQWLVDSVRKGQALSLPMEIDPGDRWGFWPRAE